MYKTPPDLKQVIQLMEAKGYCLFTDRKGLGYDLNIVGIRSVENRAGCFDDWILCFFRHGKAWQNVVMLGTTDSGRYYLEHPLNEKGAAILKPGQYRGMWKVGLHRRKYRALVQAKPCVVIRDPNRDNILDWDGNGSCEETGMFGINFHRAGKGQQSLFVGKASAGCQVPALDLHHDQIISLASRAARVWGNSFSYTLLEEKEL